MKHSSFVVAATAAACAALLAAPAFAQSVGQSAAQSVAQSVEKGKASFVSNGCWQCHGFAGQGGIAGPALAPDPKPVEFLTAFVRNSNGPMPPYSEKILSRADLADIHAYLKSALKEAVAVVQSGHPALLNVWTQPR